MMGIACLLYPGIAWLRRAVTRSALDRLPDPSIGRSSPKPKIESIDLYFHHFDFVG